jgi:hypothetical protein
MNGQQPHEMVLEKTHPSGAEEWYCPTCGRRMTITWEPWKKIVLEPGDHYVAHSASKAGLQMGSLRVTSVDDIAPQAEPDATVEEARLAPWLVWLEEVDFDSLWNSEVQ